MDETKQTGFYSVTWNAGNIASGVNIYHILTGNFSDDKTDACKIKFNIFG